MPPASTRPNLQLISPPTTPAFAELGISGVSRYGAISRVYEEFLRELQGPAGMKLLREQADNCPVTGAFMFAAEHLARGAHFRFEPATGPNVDQRRAQQVAERVESAIFDDMETTWPDTLSDILTMLPFGWAAMEMVFKRCRGIEPPREIDPATGLNRDGSSLLPPAALPSGQGAAPSRFAPSRFDDGFIGFRKWGLRAQETLFMWEWDNESNATVLQQMAPPDFRIRRVPLSKCLHFRTKVAKNNPEGRSVLRNSVMSYLYRKNIQWVESVGIERDLAGYPVFTVTPPDIQKGINPPDLWNKNDPNAIALLSRVQQIARNIRRDEQEGLVLPWWLQFSLMQSGSRRQFDTNAIIMRYDQRIAMSLMADFVMLGHEAVGSKALAEVKSSLFASALNSFLDSICAVVNRFGISLLLKLNGIPQEYAPELMHSDVENVPLSEIGGFISALARSGAPLFPNPDLEEELLTMAKLPVSDPAARSASLAEQAGVDGGAQPAPAPQPGAVPPIAQPAPAAPASQPSPVSARARRGIRRSSVAKSRRY